MNPANEPGLGSILTVFVLALLLTITPMPQAWQELRPSWTALALIFWCLAAPSRIGVFSGWLLGLAEDSLTGALLGQNALMHVLTAFVCQQMYVRIRVYPIWQQSSIVLGLLFIEQLLNFWIISSTGHAISGLGFWLAPLLGALIWALAMGMLGRRRRWLFDLP